MIQKHFLYFQHQLKNYLIHFYLTFKKFEAWLIDYCDIGLQAPVICIFNRKSCLYGMGIDALGTLQAQVINRKECTNKNHYIQTIVMLIWA